MKKVNIDLGAIKRLRGVPKIKTTCPNCGSKIENLEDYFSCPHAWKIHYAYFYCDECEKEFYIDVEIGKAWIEVEFDVNQIYET